MFSRILVQGSGPPSGQLNALAGKHRSKVDSAKFLLAALSVPH